MGGHITEQGKREIEKKTNERIKNIIGDNLDKTTFLVIGSPTYWLSKECYGQRARETENITKQAIKSILLKQGIDSKYIQKHFYNKKQTYTRNKKQSISIQELAKMLAEPNVYDEAPEYIRKLKLKHGGMTDNFWEELSKSEEAKEYSETAETPSVLNERLRSLLQYITDWAKSYSKDYDTDICVILITHGETMQPFLNNQKLRGLSRFWI